MCRYSKNSGQHFKPHIHETFSIGAIDQGQVTYKVGKQSRQLLPGRLAIVNPEVLHCCNPDDNCQRTYYMLYLDIDWCLQVQYALWGNTVFRPVTAILLEDNAIYHEYLTTMKSLMTEEADKLEKECTLVKLVESIFLSTSEETILKKKSSSNIDRLKHELIQDLEIDISLREIAKPMNANPYTLLRNFKVATGITPHAYRLNFRIERAKKLLQKGVDVSQVALECGFYDQSHLHRHFKALTAVTPKKYQVNFVQ